MNPFGPLTALLETRPGSGWLAALLTSGLGSLPLWLAETRDILGIASIGIGLVIGYLTVRIQGDIWRERREKRAEKERQESLERERNRLAVLDDELPPWQQRR